MSDQSVSSPPASPRKAPSRRNTRGGDVTSGDEGETSGRRSARSGSASPGRRRREASGEHSGADRQESSVEFGTPSRRQMAVDDLAEKAEAATMDATLSAISNEPQTVNDENAPPGGVDPLDRYGDLIIFEETMRREYLRLRRIRRRYTLFFATLVAWSAFFLHGALIQPSSYYYVLFLHRICALAGLVTLLLFYASGLYASTLVAPRKFLPHANRALRHFNCRLVREKRGWWSWSRRAAPAAFPARIGSACKKARSPRSWFGKQTTEAGAHRHDAAITPLDSKYATDEADGIRLVLTAKAGSTAFREGWERYRETFWATIAEREALARTTGVGSRVPPGKSTRPKHATQRTDSGKDDAHRSALKATARHQRNGSDTKTARRRTEHKSA